MPPRKKPQTLQELSLKTVARLTSELCVNIERKHGSWKCQASRDELEIGKMYLSSIRPLFDDLWREVYEMCFCSRDILQGTLGKTGQHLLLELLMCDKLGTFEIYDFSGCFDDSIIWKNQILKLKNIVVLDIQQVRLTDECFQAIGDVCTNVRKLWITSNLEYASMESLKHILKCQELRVLEIVFHDWKDDRILSEYVGMLVVGLPNLEYFHNLFFYWKINEVIALTKPLTSMRKLDKLIRNWAHLTEMIRVCPNLTYIKLWFPYRWVSLRTVKQDKTLKVLAESSLQLKTLKLNDIAYSKELALMISCKGSHLTILDMNVCRGRTLSVNDVYTIGVSCPKLVELRISEFGEDLISNGSDMEEQKFVYPPPPPMFVGLKVLELDSIIDWDQRIVPLILRHADNLTELSLDGVFKPTDPWVDPLLQILDANALRELECLNINAVTYNGEINMTRLPIASIERLLNNCHKLRRFGVLRRMDATTIEYLTERERSMKSENFDIMLLLDFRRQSWTY